MTEIISIWRDSLHTVLDLYERKRGSIWVFFPLLFIFFVILNVSCYWWAIYTAFPYYMQTHEASHYVKLQIPVGFLGALFDSLSFFVTIWIIKRALAASKTSEYIFHLSLDLVIALFGNHVGAARLYFWRVDDKSVGEYSRTTWRQRCKIHQPCSTGNSGPDRTGEHQKHLLWYYHGCICSFTYLFSYLPILFLVFSKL